MKWKNKLTKREIGHVKKTMRGIKMIASICAGEECKICNRHCAERVFF